MGENTVSLGNEEDGYAESHTIESQTSLAWSTVSPHYDASKDVILRMEFLSEKQMKVFCVLVAKQLPLYYKAMQLESWFLQDICLHACFPSRIVFTSANFFCRTGGGAIYMGLSVGRSGAAYYGAAVQS